MIELSTDKLTLGGVFGDIPMSIYKSARLNITFDCDEETYGVTDDYGENFLIHFLQLSFINFIFIVTIIKDPLTEQLERFKGMKRTLPFFPFPWNHFAEILICRSKF